MPAPDGISLCELLLGAEYASVSLTAHALQVRALFQAMQGDFAAARRSSTAAWAQIEEYGLTLLKGIYSLDVGFAEMLAGDLDRAEHELRRGHDLMIEMGDTGVRSTGDALLSDVFFLQGRDDEALELAESSRAIAAVDDLDSQPRWRIAKARVLSRGGEHDEALELLHDARELAEPTDFIGMQAYLYDVLGEALTRTGRTSEAEAAVERAIALHEQKGNVVSAARSRTVLSELRATPS